MFIRQYRRGGKCADINIAHIITAESREGGWDLTTIRGETYPISDLDWKVAMEMTVVNTYPAHLGTFLLGQCEEENGSHSLMKTTVLGWATYADGVTRPVVGDSEEDFHDGWAVEMPNGSVESNTLKRWASVEHWLANEPL